MDSLARYQSAREVYRTVGVDTDAALEQLKGIPVSVHCWQGDDVTGFDHDGPLTGGIQVTGNYPGRARNPDELMADIEKALSLAPGRHRLNLHACYAIFEPGEVADRDGLEPKHFQRWVDFAEKNRLSLDFNPTFFAHPKVTDGLTLSSPIEAVRRFWIDHGKACIRISEHFAAKTGSPCLMNIWIPDGYKDIPADRLGPRARFKASLDEILSLPYDRDAVKVSLESKVFGIGLESYTVGSAEFAMSYAMQKGILCLLDNGHFHPTETVSDKISSLLLFFDELALHITRPVRWDSDHVVLYDDETREIAKEIVRNRALDRVHLGLDYFDASINRISAWVSGMRNLRKAFLFALLQPYDLLRELQETNRLTELMVLQEELKLLPMGDVWNHFCETCGMPPDGQWFSEILHYERDVLSRRN